MEIILANPRGFCAGVERALDIVEKALIKYGTPIFVHHEIVHNQYVVENLIKKGVIFVDEIKHVPDNANLIFSAHGVSLKVEEEAKKKNLNIIDATCPLVKKVHNEAVFLEEEDYQIILIGHRGHPEVDGTAGRIKQKVQVVSVIEDIETLNINNPEKISYITQTTLSVDDTIEIIKKLKEKFPNIKGPDIKNICYATQNRQNAVRELSQKTDIVLVIGSKNSSNSNRLKDLALQLGIDSYLISSVEDIDLNWFKDRKKIGITAGASAPEKLVNDLVNYLKHLFNAKIINMEGKKENVRFKLPKILEY